MSTQKFVRLGVGVLLTAFSYTSVAATTDTTTTMKIKDVAVGSVINVGSYSYVKLADNTFMQTEVAACPEGKVIAGDHVHCQQCPANATYDTAKQTCTCASGYTYSTYSNSCVHNHAFGKLYSSVAKADITPIEYGCKNPVDTLQNWGANNSCDAFPAASNAGVNEEATRGYSLDICLMDERDGRTYQVRKFVDGQCWMVTNLAYGGDLADGTTTDQCWTTTYTGATSETTATNGNLKAIGKIGSCRAPWAVTGDKPNLSALSSNPTAYVNSNYATVGLYGYLYDWAAAIQDKNGWQGNDYRPDDGHGGSVKPTRTKNIQGICPDGWHLPHGGGMNGCEDTASGYCGDFANLSKLIFNRVDNTTYPLEQCGATSCAGNQTDYGNGWFFRPGMPWNGAYGGRTDTGTSGLAYQGSCGYYWSSSQYSDTDAYYLYFDYNGGVGPQGNGNKSLGRAVRCIAN